MSREVPTPIWGEDRLDSLVSVDHGRPADLLIDVDRPVKAERRNAGPEPAVPADVVDRLLWRDDQHMLHRHSGANERGLCVWCGRDWPCAPRRLAERAENAAFKPWNEAWTARNDLHSLRATPSWRADLEHPPRHARNPGLFD